MSEYITFSEKQNFITKTTNERKDTDKGFFQILLWFKSLKSAIVMQTLYILRGKKKKENDDERDDFGISSESVTKNFICIDTESRQTNKSLRW